MERGARYLIHDRDSAFHAWTITAAAIGIEEILTAPRSPWQNAYAERMIGSSRRECLDHIIFGDARGLRRVLHAYVGVPPAIAGTNRRRSTRQSLLTGC